MDIQRKSFPVAEYKMPDEEKGIIEAIVSVFGNKDSGHEIMQAGAFSESLARKMPKGVWAHRWDQPIARTLEARELAPGDLSLPSALSALGGLYIKGQFNLETQRGREAYSDIKFGVIDEFSVGYSVIADEYDRESDVRTLTKCDLYEWSPVLVGMNDQTQLLSVKAENNTQPTNDEPLAGQTFAEELQTVLATVQGVVTRAKAINEVRAKEGRMISSANRERMQAVVSSLRETMSAMDTCCSDMEDLLSVSEKPEKSVDTSALAANLYAELIETQIHYALQGATV